MRTASSALRQPTRLYTPAERRRRDASGWTTVQAVLAPLQFLVFLLSLACVAHALATGRGYTLATGSVLLKTGVLALIMATGMAWEKAVYGRWLFAPAFWWEDAVSLVVLALHGLYVAALVQGGISHRHLLLLALVAYATYLFNAGQYLLKFRRARLTAVPPQPRRHVAVAG